ncbi:DUF3575 domain-containing protein [Polaribacter litorisediminis]|uniref:DUF3575 domain-containing protein n=1 Tax=Polaribacter litorisediminis TaxID=1908341 RepID=UPI001CBF1D0F|nr:DUF3575 domain-containing protein [Polaribacter litorisediminis]UAM97347.1 DUF3575 domain-containing protein [Polaribacter litorisediminis]
MKKIIVLFTLFLSTYTFSQKEIKLDIVDAIAIKSLELSYENYVTDDSSVGISALFNLEAQDVDFRYNENMMITPYYRHYFSTDKQWNFFGEGFIGINSGKKETVKNSGEYDVKYTDGALGIAIGTKYLATSGLVIDAYAGIGRNLFGSESPVIVPRIGLNIGWRL